MTSLTSLHRTSTQIASMEADFLRSLHEVQKVAAAMQLENLRLITAPFDTPGLPPYARKRYQVDVQPGLDELDKTCKALKEGYAACSKVRLQSAWVLGY